MSTLAVVMAANAMWMGCSAATNGVRTDGVAHAPPAARDVISAGHEATTAHEAATVSEEVAASLPDAPWADALLGSEAVPAPILSAWEHAENRNQCAPLVPVALGRGEGARPRVGQLEGGWAVEFDRRGMPGIDRDGEMCERCGRGVFGIAGTNLTPEDLVTEDSDADLPAPSFADGSHLSVEPPAEGEQVAAAIITVRGQGCVYQVWSFLGEDHVRELVSSLRLVDVQTLPSQVAAR
jgi:hypothetical protein